MNIIQGKNNLLTNSKPQINFSYINNTQTNNLQQNFSIIRNNNVQKIILSSKKGEKKTLFVSQKLTLI